MVRTKRTKRTKRINKRKKGGAGDASPNTRRERAAAAAQARAASQGARAAEQLGRVSSMGSDLGDEDASSLAALSAEAEQWRTGAPAAARQLEDAQRAEAAVAAERRSRVARLGFSRVARRLPRPPPGERLGSPGAEPRRRMGTTNILGKRDNEGMFDAEDEEPNKRLGAGQDFSSHPYVRLRLQPTPEENERMRNLEWQRESARWDRAHSLMPVRTLAEEHPFSSPSIMEAWLDESERPLDAITGRPTEFPWGYLDTTNITDPITGEIYASINPISETFIGVLRGYNAELTGPEHGDDGRYRIQFPNYSELIRFLNDPPEIEYNRNQYAPLRIEVHQNFQNELRYPLALDRRERGIATEEDMQYLERIEAARAEAARAEAAAIAERRIGFIPLRGVSLQVLLNQMSNIEEHLNNYGANIDRDSNGDPVIINQQISIIFPNQEVFRQVQNDPPTYTLNGRRWGLAVITPPSEDATGAPAPTDALPQTTDTLISPSSQSSSPSPQPSAQQSALPRYGDWSGEHPWASPVTTGGISEITDYLITWLISNPPTYSNLYVPLLHEIFQTQELQEQRRAWAGIIGTDWDNWVIRYREILRNQGNWAVRLFPYRGYINARDQERLLSRNRQLELDIATWVGIFITTNAPNAVPPQPNPSPTSTPPQPEPEPEPEPEPTFEHYIPKIRARIQQLRDEIERATRSPQAATSSNRSRITQFGTEQALLNRILVNPNGEEARRYMADNPLTPEEEAEGRRVAAATAAAAAAAAAGPTTENCPICLEEMNLSRGEGYKLSTCPHFMHMECLRRYIIHQNERSIPPECPYCKVRMDPNEIRSLGIHGQIATDRDNFQPPDDGTGPERRVDRNGREYTYRQFINHYGVSRGRREWARAGRLMAEGDRDPPRRQGTGGGKRSKSKRSKSKTKKKSKRSKSKRNKTKKKSKRSKSKRRV